MGIVWEDRSGTTGVTSCAWLGVSLLRRTVLMVALAAGTMAVSGGAQAASVIPGSIVAPDASAERLFDGAFWAEGPAAGPDGRIYFCDITMTFWDGMEAGNIWAYDPDTGTTSLFRSPSGMAAGIKFDREGRMVVAEGADFGGRGVLRTDMESGRSTVLAGLYNGRPLNAPNDLDIDRQGRVYFTDPRYFGHEAIEQPVNGVYRIDIDGTVNLILADVARPNGIAISPDGKTLYVAELDSLSADLRLEKVPQRNGAMHLLAYDLSPDGTANNRRVLVDYGDEIGADGITVDAEGNIYAAVSAKSRPGIRVYDPSGREVAYIPLAEEPTVTNLALAQYHGQTHLYITAKKSLYRIRTLIPPRDW